MASSVLETVRAEDAARCRPMLGTYVEIRITDDSSGANAGTDIDTDTTSDPAFDAAFEAAFNAAFNAIGQCETLMSFHDRHSELSRINRASAGEIIDVHPWTSQVLSQAIELFELTDGVFDAGVGAQLVGWGMLPSPSPVYAGRNASLSDIELFPGQVRVLRRTCLDLGGIAKGFAVDRAADALSEHGVTQAIINAGGDLRVLGDVPYPIHVRHPGSPAMLVRLGELADGALATSAPYFSRQPSGQPGTEVCALINAHSREPVIDVRSYTVIAPECWMADALTKVLAAGVPSDSACFSHYRAKAMILQG